MLIAENITKTYEKREVLSGVSLAIDAGDFVSIIGESGSGKSTLLNIMAGNMRPDFGRVTLDGVEISSLDEREMARLRRTSLGFVHQSLNLIPTLNAIDNILLPIYLGGGDIAAARERAMALSKTVGIENELDKLPSEMSGGQRQRVAIVRAMTHEPKILFLDEPTGSLDTRSGDEVLSLLRELNRTFGTTVVQVTHSGRAAEYGKRTIRIKDGKIETV